MITADPAFLAVTLPALVTDATDRSLEDQATTLAVPDTDSDFLWPTYMVSFVLERLAAALTGTAGMAIMKSIIQRTKNL